MKEAHSAGYRDEDGDGVMPTDPKDQTQTYPGYPRVYYNGGWSGNGTVTDIQDGTNYYVDLDNENAPHPMVTSYPYLEPVRSE